MYGAGTLTTHWIHIKVGKLSQRSKKKKKKRKNFCNKLPKFRFKLGYWLIIYKFSIHTDRR